MILVQCSLKQFKLVFLVIEPTFEIPSLSLSLSLLKTTLYYPNKLLHQC